jgi:hypothetical protein
MTQSCQITTGGLKRAIQTVGNSNTQFRLDVVLIEAVKARLQWPHRPRHFPIDGIEPGTSFHPRCPSIIKK